MGVTALAMAAMRAGRSLGASPLRVAEGQSAARIAGAAPWMCPSGAPWGARWARDGAAEGPPPAEVSDDADRVAAAPYKPAMFRARYKRLLQRVEFAKKQAEVRRNNVKANNKARDERRVARWRAAAERMRAWKAKQEQVAPAGRESPA